MKQAALDRVSPSRINALALRSNRIVAAKVVQRNGGYRASIWSNVFLHQAGQLPEQCYDLFLDRFLPSECVAQKSGGVSSCDLKTRGHYLGLATGKVVVQRAPRGTAGGDQFVKARSMETIAPQ
jgi:hypothetical protein